MQYRTNYYLGNPHLRKKFNKQFKKVWITKFAVHNKNTEKLRLQRTFRQVTSRQRLTHVHNIFKGYNAVVFRWEVNNKEITRNELGIVKTTQKGLEIF